MAALQRCRCGQTLQVFRVTAPDDDPHPVKSHHWYRCPHCDVPCRFHQQSGCSQCHAVNVSDGGPVQLPPKQ